ncbi:amidohydrolase [soil metagenome]
MSSLTVTLIQTSLHWEDKAANLLMLAEKIASIADKTEIIVLPEMFSTGFSMKPAVFAETMDGETINWMRQIAGNKRVILTGSIIIKEEDNYYNRLIWMLPTGEYGYYNKRHLFAYAKEDQYYTPGSKRLIASVKGWKINLQVCYDLRFPIWARQQMQHSAKYVTDPEYDLLIYTANWPERRSYAWRTLLQARAIENQCYVIGVNRVGDDGNNIYHSGDSMVIDPLGASLYHKAHDEDVFTITLEKELLNETRSHFPFWKDADNFTIINE